jgi:hypothetical protein
VVKCSWLSATVKEGANRTITATRDGNPFRAPAQLRMFGQAQPAGEQVLRFI